MKYSKLPILFNALLIIVFLSSCSYSGTYVANHNVGVDTLKLFSTHKFTRICYPDFPEDTVHFIDTGTWNIEGGLMNKWVDFSYWHDRNEIDSGRHEINKNYVYAAHVDRACFIGKVSLLIDYDMEYYYIEQ